MQNKPLNKSDWINDDLVKKRLDKVWEVEGDYFKACFEEVIVVLKAHHKKYKNQIKNRQFITRRYQSMIGAHGIGKTAINIGLCSDAALKDRKNGKATVKDHVFGYVSTSRIIVDAFLKNTNNENEQWYEEWLKDNFHLWLVIEVSKKEHKSDNINRANQQSEESIDYDFKLKLNHYKEVSDLYLRDDFKINFKNLDYKNKLVESRKD